MIKKYVLRYSILFVLVFSLLAGCSTTLVGSWSDPSQELAPIKSILILGVMNTEMDRRMYEDLFVKNMGKSGVTGIAGYTVMPNQEDYDEGDDIRAAVQKTGADAALIARLVSVEEETVVVPATTSVSYQPSYGYNRGMYDYYGSSYRTTYTPGYTKTNTVVNLETTVFSTETENMIWAGSTRSFNPGSAKAIINANVDLIMKDMKKAGLLQ